MSRGRNNRYNNNNKPIFLDPKNPVTIKRVQEAEKRMGLNSVKKRNSIKTMLNNRKSRYGRSRNSASRPRNSASRPGYGRTIRADPSRNISTTFYSSLK